MIKMLFCIGVVTIIALFFDILAKLLSNMIYWIITKLDLKRKISP